MRQNSDHQQSNHQQHDQQQYDQKQNRYQLTVHAYDRLGELERILRVIRHRGGHINRLTMQSDNAIFTLNIQLSTERAIETIESQITKLANVRACAWSAE